MAKHGIVAIIVAGCFGAGVAQAGGVPVAAVDRIAASPYAAGVASYGVPAEFSLLLLLLLLALMLPCIAVLLWIVRSELKPSRAVTARNSHRKAPPDVVVDALLL